MSNVMPEFIVDSMTAGILLRINPDHSIDAKMSNTNNILAPSGSFRINGQLFTVTSTSFVRKYPV